MSWSGGLFYGSSAFSAIGSSQISQFAKIRKNSKFARTTPKTWQER
jgi:hypothetical protein